MYSYDLKQICKVNVCLFSETLSNKEAGRCTISVQDDLSYCVMCALYKAHEWREDIIIKCYIEGKLNVAYVKTIDEPVLVELC